MNKKIKYYLSVLLISGILFGASPSQAQLVAGVSFDFLGDAAASITPIFEQIQTKADEAIKFVKEKVTALKASIGLFLIVIGTFLMILPH